MAKVHIAGATSTGFADHAKMGLIKEGSDAMKTVTENLGKSRPMRFDSTRSTGQYACYAGRRTNTQAPPRRIAPTTQVGMNAPDRRRFAVARWCLYITARSAVVTCRPRQPDVRWVRARAFNRAARSQRFGQYRPDVR